MKFSSRKQRQAPTVIIISLIDILIVLLIFLMVTTTFKQQPALKLVLPESKQARQSNVDIPQQLVVTIAKEAPYFYLGRNPVTAERLQDELTRSASQNPTAAVSLRPDAAAPWEQVLKVWDIAKEAGFRPGTINVLTKPPTKQR